MPANCSWTAGRKMNTEPGPATTARELGTTLVEQGPTTNARVNPLFLAVFVLSSTRAFCGLLEQNPELPWGQGHWLGSRFLFRSPLQATSRLTSHATQEPLIDCCLVCTSSLPPSCPIPQLRGDADKFRDSEAGLIICLLKVDSSVRGNPGLRTAAEEPHRTPPGRSHSFDVATQSSTARVDLAPLPVSSTIEKMPDSTRNAAAYTSVAETIVDVLYDIGKAKHAVFEGKELRRRRRQLRLAKAGQEGRAGKIGRVKANPE